MTVDVSALTFALLLCRPLTFDLEANRETADHSCGRLHDEELVVDEAVAFRPSAINDCAFSSSGRC